MPDPLSLAVTSASPVVVLTLLAGTGALMAHKGTLNKQGTGVLANMCFHVFTPALIFSTLVEALSINSIRLLWPLLVNMTLSILVGFVLGYLAAALVNPPAEYRNIVVAAIAFGNVGNLPLVFVEALCNDKGAPFAPALGDVATCVRLGTAYTAFNMCAATLFQFTIAIQMLRPDGIDIKGPPLEENLPLNDVGGAVNDEDEDGDGRYMNGTNGEGSRRLTPNPTLSDLLAVDEIAIDEQQQQDRGGPHRTVMNGHTGRIAAVQLAQRQALPQDTRQLPGSPSGAFNGINYSNLNNINSSFASFLAAPNSLGPDTYKYRNPRSKSPIRAATGGQPPDHSVLSNEEMEESHSMLAAESSWQAKASSLEGLTYSSMISWRPSTTLLSRLKQVDWAAAFPLPTQAAIFGVIIGCIPPLKGLLYVIPGSNNPPLVVVSEALRLLGEGLIPGAIPLLGAVLYRGPGKSRLPWHVTATVLFTRLVVLPLVMTVLVVSCLKLNAFELPNSMALLSMLLANATPTAINMQTITVLYGHGEQEMSTILFFQYLASLLTLPVFMTLFLKLITVFC